MNLSEALKGLSADIVRDIDLGKYISATRDDAEAASLAADIIDSLPKAQDGSVIWKGCWCVLRVGRTVHITRCWGYDAAEQRGWFGDNDKSIDDVWFTIEGASGVLSTHRTRDEAEAAAAKAGENQ